MVPHSRYPLRASAKLSLLALSAAALTVRCGPGGCCGTPFGAAKCGPPYVCSTDQDCQTYFGAAGAFCAQPGQFCAVSQDGGGFDGGPPDGGGRDGGTTDSGRGDAGPAPIFVITVEIPLRDSGMYVDPQSPNGWRRDEFAVIDVSSSDPTVDAGSVVAALFGTDGMPSAPVPVTATSGCGQPYCGTAALDLAQPSFAAFRGALAVTVSGNNALDVQGKATNTIPVTRWRWALPIDAGAVLLNTPAIGARGTAYVSSGDFNVDGVLYAIDPQGDLLWAFDAGSSLSGPSVGSFGGGRELVYAATSASVGNRIFAVDGNSGTTVSACGPFDPGVFDTVFSVAVTQTQIGGEVLETGLTVTGVGSEWAVRPESAIDAGCVLGAINYGGTNAFYFGNIAVDSNNNIYFGDGFGNVQSLSFLSSSGWAARQADAGWPVNASYSPNRASLAITGPNLVGGSSAGVFSISTPLASVVWSSDGGDAWDPVVASGNQIFVSGYTQPSFITIQLGAPEPSATTAAPGSRVNALVGSDGLVYAFGQPGTIWVLDSHLSLKWSAQLSLSFPSGGPAIDCSRDAIGAKASGRPGVLYLPYQDGLYSIVVDSHGIDTTAPWPQEHHDPRRTGNVSTSMAEFGCP